MDNNLFDYLARLESMAFFSAYPLIYAFVFFLAGAKEKRRNIQDRIARVLPFAYALVGTLYLGYQLKNLYPDYSLEHIRLSLSNPALVLWGVLAMCFWIPALAKKPALSLIHSLVFFFFLLRDIFFHLAGKSDIHVVRNAMKIYTDSILMNLVCLVVILGISFLVFRKPTSHT